MKFALVTDLLKLFLGILKIFFLYLLLFRHWQSPTAILELCWRNLVINYEIDNLEPYCITIDHKSQFHTDPFSLKTISNKPINVKIHHWLKIQLKIFFLHLDLFPC